MARPTQTTDEAILAALVASPEVTSAEIASVLGIGQSTAAKRLAALEAFGSARRTPGDRVAGRRTPDRWLATDAPAALGPPQAAVAGPEPAQADAAAAADTDADTAPSGATAADGEPPETGARLGRGGLEALVREYLAARPEESFGPAAVGKALGRSQGAVSNSLAKMAGRGDAVLVADKPRRYRVARSD